MFPLVVRTQQLGIKLSHFTIGDRAPNAIPQAQVCGLLVPDRFQAIAAGGQLHLIHLFSHLRPSALKLAFHLPDIVQGGQVPDPVF